MGIWSRLFGMSRPQRGSLFEDRNPIERVSYYFQHVTLREATFHGSHDRWREVIESGRFSPPNARYFWAKATSAAVSAAAVPSGMLNLLSTPAAEAALEAGVAILTDMTVSSHRHDLYSVRVFETRPPKFSGDAHFIGVVTEDHGLQRSTETATGVRYFLLEASLFPEPMLCEYMADGSRLNHGTRLVTGCDAFVSEVISLCSIKLSGQGR